MERCPCCNARLAGSALCPRCQADLDTVINSEQAAQFWLCKAIQYWGESEAEQSLGALIVSLHLKRTELAVVFRDFLIQQLYRDVLELLAQKQLLPAKQKLYRMRSLLPYSLLLQRLQTFTDYLLVEKSKIQQSHPVIDFVRKRLENRVNYFNLLKEIVAQKGQ